MEQEKTVDAIFKKGFEHGYWLQRGNSPELAKLMQTAAGHEGYLNGLKAGSKEAEQEIFLATLKKNRSMGRNEKNGPRLK